MKRFLSVAGAATLVLLLFFLWLSRDGKNKGDGSELPASETLADDQSGASIATPGSRPTSTAPIVATGTNSLDEINQRVRKADEAGNTPAEFYGLVVDQENNALPNATVDLAVIEEWTDPSSSVKTKASSLWRQTGTDGRFEVSGSNLRGKYVVINTITKEGYEQDYPGRGYGPYGTQSGSFTEPIILRMWSTNIPHEKLITGKKWFSIIPDGRRYGVDLTNAVIAEGAEGDLVVWIKRPASVDSGGYGWSCELTATGGLLEENRGQTMSIAPAAGYTNIFAYEEEAGMVGWQGGFYGKRFYVRLRSGQLHGRVAFHLRASPSREGPAMVGFEYTINPSGSRLLR